LAILQDSEHHPQIASRTSRINHLQREYSADWFTIHAELGGGPGVLSDDATWVVEIVRVAC